MSDLMTKWQERVDLLASGYEHYTTTGKWVGGPKLSSGDKSDIREQVKKHGRRMRGVDAAHNIMGFPPGISPV